jgi:NAD-dependent SIR2 family protein deacetylase
VTNGKGHLFVIHGNLLELACDAVLVPSDVVMKVEDYWERWKLDRQTLRSLWKPGGRVSEATVVDGQRVRYLDIGSVPSLADLDWLRDGIKAGLAAAVKDFEANPEALHNRERPLLAMPLVGVGQGGFNEKRGEALAMLLEEAQVAADSGLDVAIVCFHRSDYAALQSKRWRVEDGPGQLAPELVTAADDLGRGVKGGEVALFLGAGVSQAAGLPTWGELLKRMAERAPGGLALSPEFQRLVDEAPERAGTMLKDALGEAFEDVLVAALGAERYAVSHGLLASLRVGEVLTTNIDQLYEKAAEMPFGRQLSVLPWGHVPGRPPWLLKIHGDLKNRDLVFTKEDYDNYAVQHRPLGAVVQSLLITRHLVFVGYSLRDRDFVELANEVAAILARSKAAHTQIGTVLTLTEPTQERATQWADSFRILSAGDDDPEITNADGRLLEIFLDRMAWRAAEDEWSWILDDRFIHLLEEGEDRKFAEILKHLQIPESAKWNALREVLKSYGARSTGGKSETVSDRNDRSVER